MDLTTRCPQCGETFSASLEQLQLRKGYIRCINCAHIFDGFEAVVPHIDTGPQNPAPTSPAQVLRKPPKRYVPISEAQPTEASIAGPRSAPHVAPFTIPESALPTAGSEPVLGEPQFPTDQDEHHVPIEAPAPSRPDPSFGRPGEGAISNPSRPEPVFGSPVISPEPRRHTSHAPQPGHPPGAPPQRQQQSFAPAGTPPVQPQQPDRHAQQAAGRHSEPSRSPYSPNHQAGDEHAYSEWRDADDRHRVGDDSDNPTVYADPVYPATRAPRANSIYVEPRRAEEVDRPAPDFLKDAEDRGWAGPVWAVLTVIGLIILAAQLAYVYRNQLAQSVPWTRPILQQACQSLGCTVDYARRIDHISIMSSSLQAEPGQDQNSAERRLVLNLILRNSLNYAQEWPSLTLDLVDVSGVPVARLILAPENYLPARAVQAPFAAQSEMHLAIPITVKGHQVNGYQLGKYYP